MRYFLLIFLFSCITTPVPYHRPPIGVNISEKIIDSVIIYDGHDYLCSCVAINKNVALTAKHCIEDIGIQGKIIDSNNVVHHIDNIYFDDYNDIGILITSNNFSVWLEIEDFSNSSLSLGEPIYTYGYGCEYPKKLVLEEHHSILKNIDFTQLMLKGRACRGDSGGPAIRMNGKIVGITSRINSYTDTTEVFLTPVWVGRGKDWGSFN